MSLPIETDRLILRQMKIDDIDDLLGIFSDPIAMKYFNIVFDKSQMETWVQRNLNHHAQYGYSLYSVILRNNQRLIGDCGLETTEIEGQLVVGIGYDFLREYWNNGYATEAAMAVKNYGFRRYGFQKIYCWINPENIASQRVAEKIGMTLEKKVLRDNKTYAIFSLSRSGSP